MRKSALKYTYKAKEFSVVAEAVLQLFLAYLTVSYLPSQKYLHITSTKSNLILTEEKIKNGEIIAGIIDGLSLRTPWLSTCLMKVLTAHKMFDRRNISHIIHFGIKKNSSCELNAHAWLSVADAVLIGGENLNDFHEILRF